MFQFPAFASKDLCIQSKDTCLTTGGLPHSEISGSKVVCYLPEAYRKLQRPSSPLAAKASTVYASSLDHITQNSTDRSTPSRTTAQQRTIDTPKNTSVSILVTCVLLNARLLLSTLLKSKSELVASDSDKKPETNNLERSLVSGFFSAGQLAFLLTYN